MALTNEGMARGPVKTYEDLRATIADSGRAYDEEKIQRAYALAERALMYDWCLCSGEYSLADYGSGMMRRFLNDYQLGPKRLAPPAGNILFP